MTNEVNNKQNHDITSFDLHEEKKHTKKFHNKWKIQHGWKGLD